jgi:prepilin-type N-terminal cleavage/methylation domain-containing protein
MIKTSYSNTGLTMVEVLLSMVIIGICAVSFLLWQKTSWSQATLTNRLMLAGQVIEKKIEAKRMWISSDALQNYTNFKNTKTFTDVDQTVIPPITLNWTIYDTLHAPNGDPVLNACMVVIKASWGSGKNDTLKVSTCFARDF